MTNTFDWKNYQTSKDSFLGKVIMVTGAADGIGKAVTIALAEHGATVLMLDKKSRHLEKLFDENSAARLPRTNNFACRFNGSNTRISHRASASNTR